MKKLLAIALMLSGTLFFMSCEDEEDPSQPPQVSNPSAQSVTVGGTVELTFNFSAEAGFSTATAEAQGGTAEVTTQGETGATTGSVVVTFTAGTTAGAGSVTLTVVDADGNTDEGTAVISISASAVPSIAGVPASASIVEGNTLAVDGITLTAADGLAELTIAVNGTVAITETYAGETEATYNLAVPFDTEGIYEVLFTVTDADGDAATFLHVLTVEEIAFFTSFEPAGDNSVFLEISGSINTDYELPTADGDGTPVAYYALSGRVKVTNGATLTIPAGSVIKGRTGAGSNATALLVARGSMLMAQGTSSQPIIFTAFADDLTMQDVDAGTFVGTTLGADVAGQWGGVIICGNAPISASASEVQIEGIPTSDQDGLYGGDDEDDNSGVIEYISIRHGGIALSEGNEINGLSLGGVGSGTTINSVEVVANLDDGIEWYGGSVDIDNILVWNSGDDALDTDQDWQGTASDFLIVTPDGSAMELDGPEGPAARGGGFHQFTSGTIYAGANISFLIDWDDDTNAGVEDVYFYGLEPDYTGGIASYGGDGAGNTASWQVTSNGQTIADVFGDGAAITIEVAENANTVGVQNDDNFKWTWPGSTGTLDALGL